MAKDTMTTYRVFRKGTGPPIKGMRLTLVHNSTMVIGHKVVSHVGKTAHFTPTYSTKNPEDIKILDAKCASSPHRGIWYENLTKAVASVNEMPCGDEQVRKLIDILGAVEAEKVAKKKYKKKLTELTRLQAHKLIEESKPEEVPEVEDGAQIAKKVSERKRILASTPLDVEGAEVFIK